MITGDLIDASLAARRMDIEPLRDLRAADGVYVIPATTNISSTTAYGLPTSPQWGVLPNGQAVLERDGGRLVVAGVTDLSACRHPARPSAEGGKAAAAFGVALQLSGIPTAAWSSGSIGWRRVPTAEASPRDFNRG